MPDSTLNALGTGSSLALTDTLLQVKAGGDLKVPVSLVAMALGDLRNASNANQAITASTDTLLAGSLISPPAGLINALSVLKFKASIAKGAVGTTGPIFKLRIGTTGTVSDATVQTFTFPVGTAAADQALCEFLIIFRTVGAGSAAVVIGQAIMTHNLAATGWSTLGSPTLTPAASAGFDSSTATKISLWLTASHAATVNLVTGELKLGP